MFLKNSEILQEIICVEQILFSEICEFFKNTYFEEHLQMIASEN